MTATDYSTKLVGGWTLRLRLPAGAPAAVLLALHGLTGDERSLDIFTAQLPPEYAILAPRGPIAAPPGFSWIGVTTTFPRPIAADFSPAVIDLNRRLPVWFSALNLPSSLPIHLMGFSQGAALSLRMAFSDPRKFRKIAVLSGFLPDAPGELLPDLSAIDLFIAHGTHDETVSVSDAHRMVAALEEANANVTYCEDAVGHKLGPSCFRGLASFFSAPLGQGKQA